MFLEHNSNIVLEFVNIIMLYEHNVSRAYFVLEHIVVQITRILHYYIVGVFGYNRICRRREFEVFFRFPFCKVVTKSDQI